MSYTNQEYAEMAEKANIAGKLLKDIDGELVLVEIEPTTDLSQTIQQNQLIQLPSPFILLLNDDDVVEKNNLTKAGCGLANITALGAMVKKINVGHYEIVNTLGISEEDNAVEQSKDANGNVSCFLETPTEDENHVITVKVYKKKWDMDLCAVVAGDPTDIPHGSHISVKLIMPPKETTTNKDDSDDLN